MLGEVNVQAKWSGSNVWHDFGNVTVVEAAQTLMRHLGRNAIKDDEPYAVHVRYESKPDTVWTVEVTRRVVYEAKPLRFDEE